MATNKSLITWIFCYFYFRSYGYAKKNEHRPQYQALTLAFCEHS